MVISPTDALLPSRPVQKIYVTMFPCNECAKLLIQAGIREIVYHEDKLAPSRPASPNKDGFRWVACSQAAFRPRYRISWKVWAEGHNMVKGSDPSRYMGGAACF